MAALRATSGLAAALLLGAVAAEATTIVVVRSALKVYIAADSLLRAGDERSTVCKIRQHGDTLVAIAGVMAVQGVPFSVEDAFAEASASWTGTVDERADHLAGVIKAQLLGLSTVLIEGDASARELFAKRLRDQEAIQFVVARSDNGLQRVAVRLLVPSVVNDAVVVTVRPMEFDGFAVLGTSNAARTMTPGQQQLLFTLPGAEMARRLLEAEVRDAPDAVGPPLNVIEAGSGGIRWIERGAACTP